MVCEESFSGTLRKDGRSSENICEEGFQGQEMSVMLMASLFHPESERLPAGENPLRGNVGRQMEQFSQESDEELHGRDDTSGRVVSKVIALSLPGLWKTEVPIKSTGPLAK